MHLHSLSLSLIPPTQLFSLSSFLPLPSPFSSLLFSSTKASRRRTIEMAGSGRGEEYIASQKEEEEEANNLGKKYGALAPKKKPLISKDHERAFFDSADWALGKQAVGLGQNPKAAVENLRPKLQRTPHQQLPPRRPACTSGGNSSLAE